MNTLFETTRINSLVLENRFIRSATWEGLALDDGSITPDLIDTMTTLVKGGIGLIISGHAYVLREGKAGPRQLGIYDDALIPGLKQMTDAVHSHGGRILAQLAHAGNFAFEQETGQRPRVVSVFDKMAKTPRHELTLNDLDDLVQAYAAAAGRAKTAGFDGVQLHAAHGYLLSQFLSPAWNRRKDEYGGSLENRSRVIVQILNAVRERVGEEYPILIKINCDDFQENSLTLEDSLDVCTRLAENSLDAIEVSGGTLTGGKLSPSRTGITKPEKEAYFEQGIKKIRAHIQVPLILVGGIRSLETAERLIRENTCDYLSMSRPLIREPGLINRWKAGDIRPALCQSDNLCFRPAIAGKGIYCVLEEKENKRP